MTLLLKLIRKEVREVMAMLLALRIVDGKYSYNRVPKALKEDVLSCLETMGKTVDEQGNLTDLED